MGLLLLVFACLLGGCPGSSPSPPPTGDGTCHRIVAFTCGAVDILIALGQLDRIVAVEEDCPLTGTEGKVKIRNDDHPGQVHIVQVEAIMALHPDLVIAKSDLEEALGNRGMRMLWSPPIVSMETLPAFVDSIATAIGMPEKGRALVDAMHAKEKEIRARTESLPKVRVYYEVSGAGRTQGTSTISDAMIKLAGGTNAAGDDPRASVNLSPEAVVAFDPEVIILWSFAESVEAVMARPGWERVSAIRNKRVYKIPEAQRYVILGTPRCVQGCEELFLPWIHPELAGKGH